MKKIWLVIVAFLPSWSLAGTFTFEQLSTPDSSGLFSYFTTRATNTSDVVNLSWTCDGYDFLVFMSTPEYINVENTSVSYRFNDNPFISGENWLTAETTVLFPSDLRLFLTRTAILHDTFTIMVDAGSGTTRVFDFNLIGLQAMLRTLYCLEGTELY